MQPSRRVLKPTAFNVCLVLRFLEKLHPYIHAAQKMKFSIKNSFSKCGQIRGKLRIWSHLLNKYLMEDFNFCKAPCPRICSGNCHPHVFFQTLQRTVLKNFAQFTGKHRRHSLFYKRDTAALVLSRAFYKLNCFFIYKTSMKRCPWHYSCLGKGLSLKFASNIQRI